MLSILGMGAAYPETRLSNQALEEMDIGTNATWIIDKIGIESRVTSLPIEYITKERNQDVNKAAKIASTNPTKLGVEASKQALKNTGLTADKIGLVICNCCSPDNITPPESQRIASILGTTGKAYDVFTACPAFALHMDFLNHFKEEELPEYVLCISTAALTQHVNYNDRSDGAIWGDGAAAWIVSTKHKGKLTLIESHFNADPTRAEAVVVDRYSFFKQDGRAVRDFSVRQTVRLIKKIEEEHKIDWNKDIFVGHQANRTMLEQITTNRGIPDSNHWFNVTNIGNQAGAGAPAVLSMHWNKIEPGRKIVVAVVGAGLSWGSLVFQTN
jgi:3-oxoacyl-[acyl-carrier-protein] synthase-3